MSDDDPLAGADIGETRTIESENEFSLWDSRAVGPFLGFDREAADVEVKSAEIVGEEGNERVRITYSGDVTKTLRPHWRQELEREPREPRDTPTAGLPTAQRVASFLIAAAVSVGVAMFVTQSLFGRMAGETIEISARAPTVFDLAPAVAAIIVLGMLIVLALPYAPGMAGRGGMRGGW